MVCAVGTLLSLGEGQVGLHNKVKHALLGPSKSRTASLVESEALYAVTAPSDGKDLLLLNRARIR